MVDDKKHDMESRKEELLLIFKIKYDQVQRKTICHFKVNVKYISYIN